MVEAEMYNLFVWTGEILAHVVFNERFLKAVFCADGKPVPAAVHTMTCVLFNSTQACDHEEEKPSFPKLSQDPSAPTL